MAITFGHKFDSWWIIVKGKIVTGYTIVLWWRPSGPSHNLRVGFLVGQLLRGRLL